MGLKTEAWILKASHQSVNQNHVRSGSLLTEQPNLEHREEKGNTDFHSPGRKGH